MARLWSSGFELDYGSFNTNYFDHYDGIEWQIDDTTGYSSTVTSPVHGGNYSLQISGADGIEELWHAFATSNSNGPYWARIYIYITAYPNISNSICEIDAQNGTTCSEVNLNTNGSLQLYDYSGAIGSPSSVLSLNTWYCIEQKVDLTGGANHHIVEGALNGVVFATSNTRNLPDGAAAFYIGCDLELNGLTSGTWYFDDVAVNDSTGSYQNGYPGPGYIFHQNPAGAGDSTQWTIGGSTPAASNYQSVNNIPPNDGVTLVNEATASKSDFYTVGSSSLTTADTISVVHVGARFSNDTADATSAFQVQIEKTSGGTVSRSSSIVPDTTLWSTNATANITSTVNNYPITLYQDPDGSNWTYSTINSMQIGLLSGTVGTHKIQVTNVWALVEYMPSASPTAFFDFFAH